MLATLSALQLLDGEDEVILDQDDSAVKFLIENNEFHCARLTAVLTVVLCEPGGKGVDATLLDLGGKAAAVAGHQTHAIDG
jgi:hypothetical protein